MRDNLLGGSPRRNVVTYIPRSGEYLADTNYPRGLSALAALNIIHRALELLQTPSQYPRTISGRVSGAVRTRNPIRLLHARRATLDGSSEARHTISRRFIFRGSSPRCINRRNTSDGGGSHGGAAFHDASCLRRRLIKSAGRARDTQSATS